MGSRVGTRGRTSDRTRPGSARRADAIRFVAPALVVFVLLAPGLLLVGVPPGISAPPVRGGPFDDLERTATGGPSGARPSLGLPSLLYYGNNSTFASLPSSQSTCDEYASSSSTADRICDVAAQNPSTVRLANGELGVAFSRMTSVTGDACPGAAANTSIRIGWTDSSTQGASTGAIQDLGNDTCAYEQATEPSFGVGANGTVVGTFVEYNATNASPTLGAKSWTPPWNLGYRANAVLGFVASYSNGSTWTTPRTLSLAGAYVARPSLATVGSTVYIAYDNLSTTKTVFTGNGQTPTSSAAVSVELISSTDEGATWNGPYTLPGLNATEENTSMSPSVAVAPNGTLAVGYLSDRSCVSAGCKATKNALFADDIDVAFSGTNGSTWSAPSDASPPVAEDQCYGEPAQDSWYPVPCYRYVFEFGPTFAIAYDGSRLLVAYAGTNYTPNLNQYNGVYADSTTTDGATWNRAIVQTVSIDDDVYAPAVAEGPAGNAFVTYSWENESSCSVAPCNPLWNAYSQWMASSPGNGTTWNRSILISLYHPSQGLDAVGGDWTGWGAALTLPASAPEPVAAFALPRQYAYTAQKAGTITDDNYTWNSNVSLGYQYAGPTTTVNFTANGLVSAAHWGIELQNAESFSTNGTFVNVSGVPLGLPVLLGLRPPTAGYGEKITAVLEATSLYPRFVGPADVPVNFTEKLGFQLSFHPNLCAPYDFYLSISVSGTTYTYQCSGTAYVASPVMPWYFSSGLVLHLDPVTNYYPQNSWWSYWFGEGKGNYTGGQLDANVTMDSAINESVWVATYGTGNVTFYPAGVPADSEVSFDLGGTAYEGSGGAPIDLDNVSTGPLALTNITANSSRSGWQYFGSASCGSTLVVPAEQQVNLSFAYVDVGASPRSTAFDALGLGLGTAWQLTFNGTPYSTNASTLTLALKPGSYPYALGEAVAANGSVAYLPTTRSGYLNITPGTPVDLGFQLAYRVEAVAGLGGTVTGPGLAWVAPGNDELWSATASSGFTFAGWTGNGTGAYTGNASAINVTIEGPIIETAQFYALPQAHFNASFSAAGLAPDSSWTVFVGGIGYSSSNATILVPNLLSCSAGALGLYNLTIPYVYNGTNGTRWTPSGYPSRFCDPGGYAKAIDFSAQFQLTVEATSGGTALAEGENGVSNSTLWVPYAVAPTIEASPLGNASFLYWNGTGTGSYTGTTASQELTLEGPVVELAVFEPPEPHAPSTYTLTFYDSGLPVGTPWDVALNGVEYASSGGVLNVTGLTNGTYDLTVPSAFGDGGLIQYNAPGAPPTAVVKGRLTAPVTLSFAASYWVVVSASPGGTVNPSGGVWYARGSVLTLVATASAGYLFVGWTGNSSTGTTTPYTGPTASPVPFRIYGPLTEFAQFGLPAPAPKASSNSGTFGSPTVWIGFAVLGAAIGIVLGVMLARRRPPSGPGTDGYDSAEQDSADGSLYNAEPPAPEMIEEGTP